MARICSTVKFTCKEKHCYIRIKAEMKDLDVSMEHRGRHGIVTAHVRVFSGFANTTSVAQHLDDVSSAFDTCKGHPTSFALKLVKFCRQPSDPSNGESHL